MSKNRSTLRLKIGEVPKYPFVNVNFDVAIHLVDEGGQLKCGDEIPLNIKLCFDEKPLRDCEDTILQLDNPNPKISKTGTATIRAKITALSMRYENKKFILYASVDNSAGGVYISPAISEPMLSIKYRLKILDDSVPEIWYKDEGGRDKCIDLTVTLQDHNQELIVARKVPLRVTLLYESGHHVLKQDILKINPENKLMIDETGKALLRLRIEDVSKNHQKQLFTVQIVPDTVQLPLNNDISPDCCRPLEVRSKRNKRTRDPLSTNPLDRYPVTSQRTELKVSAPRPINSSSSLSSFNPIPLQPALPPHTSSLNSNNSNNNNNNININGSTSTSTTSLSGSTTTGLGTNVVGNLNGLGGGLGGTGSLTISGPPSYSLLSTPSLNSSFTLTPTTTLPPNYSSAAGVPITTSTACMTVLNWISYVMNKLNDIQWRQIGTEVGTGRALYEMTNPNSIIEEIYQRYDNEAAPMSAKLYQELCASNHFRDGKYLEEDGEDDAVLNGLSNLPIPNAFNNLNHNNSSNLLPNIGMRDIHENDTYRAGTTALLGLSNSSVALPPPRERDQSLFNLPDDLPQFQRASTTEIFDTLNINGLGPSALNDLSGNNGTHYILAKKFFSKHLNIPLGLAAFDENKKLIGWYIAHSDKFIGINDYPSRLLDSNELKKANEIGELWIESGDPSCVFSLDNHENEDKMVEEAIIWWWTNNETAESITLWDE